MFPNTILVPLCFICKRSLCSCMDLSSLRYLCNAPMLPFKHWDVLRVINGISRLLATLSHTFFSCFAACCLFPAIDPSWSFLAGPLANSLVRFCISSLVCISKRSKREREIRERGESRGWERASSLSLWYKITSRPCRSKFWYVSWLTVGSSLLALDHALYIGGSGGSIL